ncbi:MAG: YdbH domain-containing protein [Sneathiellaceae bacterium]
MPYHARMRALWIGLPALVACLLLLLAAGWLLRLPLANRVVAQMLAESGIDGSATLTRLDFATAELRDLRLDGQRADRLALRYDAWDLVAGGTIEAVEIAGLRLRGDLTAEQPFGDLPDRLSAAFGAGDGGPAEGPALPPLPALRLADARLDLATARGGLALLLDGGLGGIDAQGEQPLDLTLRTLEGPLALAGRAHGSYRPGTGTGSRIDLDLHSTTGPPVSLQARAGIAGDSLDLAATLSGDAAVLAALAALPPALQPSAGHVALRAEAAAAAAPLLAGDLAPLLAGPAGLQAFDLTVSVAELDIPDRLSGLALQAGMRLGEPLQTGPRALRMQAARAEVDALDPGWLVSIGLPPAAAQALAQGGRLALDATGTAPAALLLPQDAPPRLQLALAAGVEIAAGGRLDLDLAGDLDLPAGFPATIGLPAGRLSGRLAAGSLALPGRASLEGAAGVFDLNIGEAVEIALTGPFALTGLRLTPQTMAAIGAADWQALRDRPMDLALDPTAEPTTRLDLTGERPVLTLPREVRLAAGSALLEAVLDGRLVLTAAFAPAAGALEVQALTVRGLPTPYGLLSSLTLSGTLHGAPDALQGDLQSSLAVRDFVLQDLSGGPVQAAEIQANLATALAWDEAGLRLELSGPGSLSAMALGRAPGPVVDRLELGLATARLDLAGATLHAAADAALAPAGFDLDGSGGASDLELSAGRLLLDLTLGPDGGMRGAASADALQASHRGAALALRNGRLSASMEDGTGRLTLDGADLFSTASPPAFPPLAATGSGALEGQVATYRATLRGLNGAASGTVTGRQDFARDRGTADLRLAPLTFAPGGLQPGALSPALAGLERASGTVRAEAHLTIGDRVDGKAQLTLSDIGFVVAGTDVEGLDLDLSLSALDPPRSPPGQPFSIDRVDAGMALSDLQGQLRLQPAAGGSQLVVERATATFLDGRLSLDDAVIDPLAARYDLDLQFDRVDLARLLALAGLEDVTGSGLLTGRVPVTVEGDAIVVRDGRLDALAPGRLAFRSDAARDALAGGGESVDLMLDALEDFHYQVLGLSLDKPATGESRMLLRLEGSNPAVLDGQPFVLNINLVSNVAPLLAALARGTELSSRLVQQILRDMAQ